MPNKKSTTLKKRVFVAMSGGVDSSVVAALLVKEGYAVTGVFMKVWEPDFLPCTWREERQDAMRVAAHLGIPLLTWDFEREYKEGVADYMIREYKAGRTPNPDVMCNKEVKFGAFFRRAIAMGADYVATGHYARIAFDQQEGVCRMFAGVDETKDQSYFLWTLGQEELKKTLFPIGEYKKMKVRAMAKKFALPTAEKKDSQGLCFVGKLDMKDFLLHFMEKKEGVVVNQEGEQIGTHQGAYFYTLGERRGFTITKKTTTETPYYIIAKDLVQNTLTVAHKTSAKSLEQGTKEIRIAQMNVCVGGVFDTEKTYTARIRYHGEAHVCKAHNLNGTSAILEFEKPVLVASGQSVVLYDNDECVGGGIVE
ncbi:MAG: tRNA 2-thiouridine(34) synthase MnmA [Patescibacteria group bacterium]